MCVCVILVCGGGVSFAVRWPYECIYPEQYDYMLEIKLTLDAKGGSWVSTVQLKMSMNTGTKRLVLR